MPREKSAGAVIFTQHHFLDKSPRQRKYTKNGAGFRKEDSQIYYLLLHYRAGHWDFPKGNIEEAEKEEETVKREVKEETGIEDIKIIDGFKEWIKYFYQKNGDWIFKIVTYYLAETKTKKVKISFEHQGYKWLAYQEALETITYKNAKEILKKANDFIVSKI